MNTNPNPPTVVSLSDESVQTLTAALKPPDDGSHNFTRLVAPLLAVGHQ